MLSLQGPVHPVRCRLTKPFGRATSKCHIKPTQRSLRHRHRPKETVTRVVCTAAEQTVAGAQSPIPVPTSTVWELDFCSRPLLDERGKKVWEVLVCDPTRTFVYSRYLPSNKINSVELKSVLEELLSQPGAVQPEKCRFFRGQMQTIISKALTELGIKPLPSRRCFSLMSMLQERLESVYKQDERYNSKAQTLFTLDLGSPQPTPDALRGEQWAFVQLPLGTLQDMLTKVESADIFGSAFDLSTVGAGDLTKDTLVPGVAVFSRRALPLAAWTNGLELASISADVARSCLILESGVNQRWRYGGWRTTPDSVEEAEAWEEAKNNIQGLHFLAIQPDPDSEDVTGLWLLSSKPPPSI